MCSTTFLSLMVSGWVKPFIIMSKRKVVLLSFMFSETWPMKHFLLYENSLVHLVKVKGHKPSIFMVTFNSEVYHPFKPFNRDCIGFINYKTVLYSLTENVWPSGPDKVPSQRISNYVAGYVHNGGSGILLSYHGWIQSVLQVPENVQDQWVECTLASKWQLIISIECNGIEPVCVLTC